MPHVKQIRRLLYLNNVLYSSGDGRIIAWDPTTMTELWTIQLQQNHMFVNLVNHNGNILSYCYGMSKMDEYSNDKQINEYPSRPRYYLSGAMNGFALGERSETLIVWKLKTQRTTDSFFFGSEIVNVFLEQNIVYVVTLAGIYKFVWKQNKLDLLTNIERNFGAVTRTSMGDYIAITTYNKSLIFDKDLNLVHEMPGKNAICVYNKIIVQSEYILDLSDHTETAIDAQISTAFTPLGDNLIAYADKNSIRILDVSSMKERLQTLVSGI